jgi:hypothetical protein
MTATEKPPGEDQHARRRHRLKAIGVVAAAVAGEAFGLRRLGYGFGGKVVVRCSSGHLFTTIWVPAVSVKSLRFGLRRFQRCPVGRHWTMVEPVRADQLSQDERREAAAHRDIRLP